VEDRQGKVTTGDECLRVDAKVSVLLVKTLES
jgi:hypothetical protein